MKASTKLLSMLLLIAMCMSFMAIPAYAAGTDGNIEVGRVTADMMNVEPMVEDAVVVATADGGEEGTVVAEQTSSAVQTVKAPSTVVLKRNDGDVGYDSLSAALAAAASGDQIQLNTDLSYSSTLYIDKGVTILLNGHTIRVSIPATSAGISASGATLRGGVIVIVASPVETAPGEPAPVYSAGIVGSAALDGVSLTYSGPSAMLGGGVTVYGGSYSANPTAHLAPGYEAVEVDGRFKVRVAEVTEPAVEESEEAADAQDAPDVEETSVDESGTDITVNDDPIVAEGTETGETAAAVTTAEDGETVAEAETAEDGETAENAEAAEDGETAADAEAAEDGETAENAEAAEDGETAENAEAAEDGETAEDAEAAEDGETAENAEAAEDGETAENAEAAEDGETAAEAEAAEDGETAEDAEAAEDGETAEDAEAAEDGETAENAEVAEDGETAAETEAAENGETAAETEAAETGETAADDQTVVDTEQTEETQDQDASDTPEEDIVYSTDKVDYVGATTITVSGAPEEAELKVGTPADYEDAITEAAGDVRIVLPLDIDVTGAQLTEPVTITVKSDVVATLSENAKLFHVKNGVAEEVSFTADREACTLSFSALEFSPYVVTEPDEMDVQNDEDLMSVMLARRTGNFVYVKDGSIQKALDEAEENSILILTADAAWDVVNWPAAVTTFSVQLNSHKLTNDVTLPAGKTMILTGATTSDEVVNSIVTSGVLALGGTMKVTGNLTVNGGSLTINGEKVSVVGTIVANAGSSINISGGTYGAITAVPGSTGGITGGTFANDVPANLLSLGYKSVPSGSVFVVNLGSEARVKTINGAINFTRNGGNYVEYYKGTANAAKNYSYQFAVAPADGLYYINLIDAFGTTYPVYPSSDFTYDSGSGRVVFSQQTVNTLLGNLPAGRAYLQFYFDVNNDFTEDALVEVPINIYPNVTFDPTTYVIDSLKPVVFTLTTYNGGVIDEPAYITVDMKDGEDPNTKLLPATAYYYNGNQLILSASYLNGLTPGTHNFDFWYDMDFGKTIRLRCTILVSMDYRVVKINSVDLYTGDVNWYQYSGQTLSFTANANPEKFTGIKVDGYPVAAGNYSVMKDTVNGTTTVGLYSGYLAGLAQGKHTITLVFTDGEATASFSVLSASASPKTGDNNNIGLWVAMLVLSGAAVVALVPKKKKQ